jgi:hypothetical protein
MESKLRELFTKTSQVDVPSGLLMSVVARVRLEQQRAARRELVVVGSVATLSIVSIFPLVSYLMNSFVGSSFYQYFSLVFLDSSFVLVYWKEITFSLAESLPVLPITVFLSVSVLVLWSVARTTRQVRTIFRPV